MLMKISRRHKDYLIGAILAILALSVIGWTVPVPAAVPQFSVPPPPSNLSAPQLGWPPAGQAALGAKGPGVLDSYGQQQSVPTASVAKIFTALAVLNQKPLAAGETGPLITITQADLDSYESYFVQGGSLVPVTLGEQLSERQALEAMLLPSANNMADTLARWAYGSVDGYLSYINQFNAKLGLRQTHIADASGFSSSTVSSAEDLVKIGQIALTQPALASIVSEQQATLPVAGVVHNTNWLLGFNSINGIKTGNTDEAGGCYLFSSEQLIGTHTVTVIGAVMAAPSLQDALDYSRNLLGSVGSGFITSQPLAAGQSVGQYKLAWGKTVPIRAAKAVPVLYWYKKPYSQSYSAKDISRIKEGQVVGNYYLNSGLGGSSTQLVAGADIGGVPWRWRLYQRFLYS